MELRDYQSFVCEWAVKTLHEHKIAYLAMAMRTGKTPTALAIAASYGAHKVMFFTRKKAIPGIDRMRAAMPGFFTFEVMNYERLTSFLLKHDEDSPGVFQAKDFFAAYFKPDFVILDEAHCCGQFPDRAGKVKSLQTIAQGCPILYLSGTPSPESFSQLYHQFYISSFSPFKKYKTFHQWAADFVKVDTVYYFGRSHKEYKDADIKKIQSLTSHLFMSISQKEADFNQAVTDEIVEVNMEKSTYALADYILANRVYKAKDGSVILADTEAKLMQKLHQIYSGTILFEPVLIPQADLTKPEKWQKAGKVFDYMKADYIKNNFTKDRFPKMAIMYCFKEELHALQWVFGAKNLTDDEDVFKNDTTGDIIYCSQVQAGREGVDISCADLLVFYNIAFSAVSYIQARERINTKDRVKPARCAWIFSGNGIEQKIYDRVVAKMDYTLEYFKEDYLTKK